MSHALGRDASVQELRRLTNEELTRYTAHAPVFAQVVAYLTHITTTVNIYVIVTGGDWAAAIGNAFGLNYETQLWLLALHVALSIIVVISLLGMGNNFIQRLNFLDWLGVAFWPTIRQLGGHEFAWHGPSGDITVSPLSPDQARTRPQALNRAFGQPNLRWQRFFFLLPIAAAGVSIAFIPRVYENGKTRSEFCVGVQNTLGFPDSKPISSVAFERARYLFDKAGCEITRIHLQNP
jgi:hypothetical protein